MSSRALLLAFLCLASTGCFRTVYTNVLPPTMAPAVETPDTASKRTPRGWQHFFLFGLIPSEMSIDAAKLCGGEEHIRSIETEQTFVQRLIQSVAGYYINVYAPYNGHVTCDHAAP